MYICIYIYYIYIIYIIYYIYYIHNNNIIMVLTQIIMVLVFTHKKNFRCLKTDNQAFNILGLFVVSRCNFPFWKSC